MVTGSIFFTTVTVCPALKSAHFSSMFTVNVRFSLTIFKEGTGNIFLQLTDLCQIKQTCYLLHVKVLWVLKVKQADGK
jgi:hypothetical protein